MRMFVEAPKVYLHRQPIDFRKQINGLCVLVEEELGHNPFDESLYLFVNRGRTRVKILYWERNGFCLWMKRLEQDKFAWPLQSKEEVMVLCEEELQWLLAGFDLWRTPPHQRLLYQSVV